MTSTANQVADVSPIVQIPQVGTIELETTLQGTVGPGIAANSRSGSRTSHCQMFWPPGSSPRFFINYMDVPASNITVIGEIQLKRLTI
jgi:hypothetical protein